jgi:hypothetical protein
MKSSSPKKGGVCTTHTPPKTLQFNSAQNNPRSAILQPSRIWYGWEVEAGRLFSLFWRTANAKHLAAFCRHVQAMRGHVRSAR